MQAALVFMLCADADAVNEDFVRAKQLIAQALKLVKAQHDIVKDETAEVLEKVLAESHRRLKETYDARVAAELIYDKIKDMQLVKNFEAPSYPHNGPSPDTAQHSAFAFGVYSFSLQGVSMDPCLSFAVFMFSHVLSFQKLIPLGFDDRYIWKYSFGAFPEAQMPLATEITEGPGDIVSTEGRLAEPENIVVPLVVEPEPHHRFTDKNGYLT